MITDPVIWRRCVAEAIDALAGAGASIMDAMVSPLRGAEGNVEFLVSAVVDGAGIGVDEALVDRVIAEATP